jgi:hypothetical protein
MTLDEKLKTNMIPFKLNNNGIYTPHARFNDELVSLDEFDGNVILDANGSVAKVVAKPVERNPFSDTYKTIGLNSSGVSQSKFSQSTRNVVAGLQMLLIAACGGGGGSPTSPSPGPTNPPNQSGCQQTTVSVPYRAVHNPSLPINGTAYIDGTPNGTLINSAFTGCTSPGTHTLEIRGNDIYSRKLSIQVLPGGTNTFATITDVLDKVSGMPVDYMTLLNHQTRLVYFENQEVKDGSQRMIAPGTIYYDANSFRARGGTYSEITPSIEALKRFIVDEIPRVYGSKMSGWQLKLICDQNDGAFFDKKCDLSSPPANIYDVRHPGILITYSDQYGIGAAIWPKIQNGVNYDGLVVPNVISGTRIEASKDLSLAYLLQEVLQSMGLMNNLVDNTDSIFNMYTRGNVTSVDEVLGKTSMAVLPGSKSENDTSHFQTIKPVSVTASSSDARY